MNSQKSKSGYSSLKSSLRSQRKKQQSTTSQSNERLPQMNSPGMKTIHFALDSNIDKRKHVKDNDKIKLPNRDNKKNPIHERMIMFRKSLQHTKTGAISDNYDKKKNSAPEKLTQLAETCASTANYSSIKTPIHERMVQFRKSLLLKKTRVAPDKGSNENIKTREVKHEVVPAKPKPPKLKKQVPQPFANKPSTSKGGIKKFDATVEKLKRFGAKPSLDDDRKTSWSRQKQNKEKERVQSIRQESILDEDYDQISRALWSRRKPTKEVERNQSVPQDSRTRLTPFSAIKQETPKRKRRRSKKSDECDSVNKSVADTGPIITQEKIDFADQEEKMDVDILPESFQDNEELMDWEPEVKEKISNEVDIARRGLIDSKDPHILSKIVGNATTTTQDCDVIVVIDTNIFITSLTLVNQLLTSYVQGLGKPVIFVPHRVLQELDGLKIGNNLKNSTIPECARRAISFLSKGLKDKSKRIQGQTLRNYLKMDQNLISDDKILLSCLDIRQTQNKNVVLLSNDTNLRNKALIEDIPTYSATEFESLIKNSTSETSYDKSYIQFKLKNALHLAISQILECECRNVEVQETLFSAVSILLEKWRSDFAPKLPSSATDDLLEFYLCVQQVEKDGSSSYINLLNAAQKFIAYFTIESKSYFNEVKKTQRLLPKLRSMLIKHGDRSAGKENHSPEDLEQIFSDSWMAIENEKKKLSEALRQRNPLLYPIDHVQNVIEVVSTIVSSLASILAPSISSLETLIIISDLAKALATSTNSMPEKYIGIILKEFKSDKAKELFRKAEQVLKELVDYFIDGKDGLLRFSQYDFNDSFVNS